MADWQSIAAWVNQQVVQSAVGQATGLLIKKIGFKGVGGSVINNLLGELIFPDAANQNEIGLDYKALERDRLVQDGLEALRKLPIDKTYKDNKPIVAPKVNAPTVPEPKTQPGFHLPSLPNQYPIDIFWVPKLIFDLGKKAISGRSVTERIYGDSECWPVNYRTDVIFNIYHDIIGTENKEKNAAAGAENFWKWLVRENGRITRQGENDSQLESGGALTGDNLWDQVAWCSPAMDGNWLGAQGFTFGAAAICDELADAAATRQNVGLGGVRPVIYANKPTININPSGAVDTSRRFSNQDLSSSWGGLAETIKDYMEYYGERKIKQLDIVNISHGKTSRAVGADQFPMYVPRSLCNHEAEDMAKFIEEEIKILNEQLSAEQSAFKKQIVQEQIDAKQKELGEIKVGYIKTNEVFSLVELSAEITELFAEILGVFPIKIDIEPGHLLTQSLGPKGRGTINALDEDEVDPQDLFEVKTLQETIKMRFPNVADTLAEMEGSLLTMQGIQNVQQEFFSRIATEICSIKQALITTHDMVDCLFDWAGMKVNHHDDYYLLSFDPMIASDPENEEILKFLIGRKIKYKKPVFAIDKDNQTLTSKMFWYDRAASIVQASLYRRFTSKEQFKDPASFFRNAKALYDQFSGFEGTGPDGKFSTLSWEQFKEMFESGFNDETSTISDDTKPWGEDKDNRPQIKDTTAIVGDIKVGVND